MSAGQFTKCLHSKERSAPLLRRRRRRRTAFALVRFGIPRRTDIDEYRVLTYFHDLIPRYTDILAFSEDRTSVPDKSAFSLPSHGSNSKSVIHPNLRPSHTFTTSLLSSSPVVHAIEILLSQAYRALHIIICGTFQICSAGSGQCPHPCIGEVQRIPDVIPRRLS